METLLVRQPYSPATKVVAPQGNKSRADFYTDGINDDIQIQAAITAVKAQGGGSVYISPGIYQISSDITLDTVNNVKVYGVRGATQLKTKAGTSANGIKIINCNNIVIQDLELDGNKTNVNQLSIQYLLLSGIFITGSTKVTVKDCFIHDQYVSGILADSSNDLILKDNIIENCFDNGIFLRPNASFTGCNRVSISGNLTSGMSFSGIQAIGSNYLTITNNVSHDNGGEDAQGDGIGIEGCSHVTIGDNVCYTNAIQGINVRYTDEMGETSLGCSHVVVTGNEVYNNTSINGDAGGIQINATDDALISNNLVFANSYGINIGVGDNIQCANITITGNTLKGNTKNGISIVLSAQSHFLLSNNFVLDNTEHALFSNVRILVQGGIYKGSTGNGMNGIKFDAGSDNSIVDGAYIYDNKDNGILIDGTTVGILVKDCVFDNIDGSNQARALYEASGSGPTTMIRNIIKNQAVETHHFEHVSSTIS